MTSSDRMIKFIGILILLVLAVFIFEHTKENKAQKAAEENMYNNDNIYVNYVEDEI